MTKNKNRDNNRNSGASWTRWSREENGGSQNSGFHGRNGNNRGGHQNNGSGRGRGRKFQKFVDFETRESREPDYWSRQPRQSWTANNNYNNQYNAGKKGRFGGTTRLYNTGTGVLETDQNFGYTGEQPQMFTDNLENVEGNREEHLEEPSTSNMWSNEGQISARKDSFSTNVSSTPQPESVSNVEVDKPKMMTNIKQEKQEILKLKTEIKSSSSSSSSSDSSSGEEEPEKTKPGTTSSSAVKPTTSSSPLAIKLKPLAANNTHTTISVSPSVNIAKNIAPPTSSSSSSEDEEVEQPQPVPSINIYKDKSKQSQKSEKLKKKEHRSEDDVVCMGNLENKIILEDDDNQTDDGDEDDHLNTSSKSTKSKKKSKKSVKKSVEQCMICDKKGHTSFQCQMICKNCSAPYHGFRTCPQPANINTMMQLYMEFCMQQLQHFQPERQFQHLLSNTNTRQTVPQPLVGSPSTNKPRKRKKSKLKAKETSKGLMRKKLKLSAKKRQTNDDDEDSENTTPDSDEETSSDSDDDSTSEGFESLTTSKHKKSKAKHKNNSTIPINAFDMANFMPNHPINYPLTLNGLNMAAQPANPQLNTLLLTQMFQNAIGSLNSKQRS